MRFEQIGSQHPNTRVLSVNVSKREWVYLLRELIEDVNYVILLANLRRFPS
jgi:hypothetical protein